jgi:hypothetical protein
MRWLNNADVHGYHMSVGACSCCRGHKVTRLDGEGADAIESLMGSNTREPDEFLGKHISTAMQPSSYPL